MQSNYKILIVFGTRPEAIKMAPLVKALSRRQEMETKVCITAQHRQMLDQVLELFEITPDYDLDIMRENQTLASLSALMLEKMDVVISDYQPDRILVHGDTSTTMVTSLAAFYRKVPVGHVEAGLRTGNLYSPWPEELNRKFAGMVSDLHFAPTAIAQENLLAEGVKPDTVVVTGNTVIDALLEAKNILQSNEALHQKVSGLFPFLDSNKKLILVTGHRRESFGDGFKHICLALKEIAEDPDTQIVYPVHLNPNVQGPVHETLGDVDNCVLIKPQDYLPFVFLMLKADLILTDSGGIQEEAPTLGKPVLVMRETTERPEAVNAGVVKLVGTDRGQIVREVQEVLAKNAPLSSIQNPYGDGCASEKIVEVLLEHASK